MEVDNEPFLVNSIDQLYHLLKTDSFTFCLICLEDITDDLGKHLNSANHVESIKRLFKACNPSLTDDVEDERFTDMVLKSVFDISVLLGQETCYVSKRENYWFCVMCKQNVTESNFVDAVVKIDIINHVLCESHVKKVKEVCFMYRLNDNLDFLLLNKSVVYCSICKSVKQCKEKDLLRAAVGHVEVEHSNFAVSDGIQLEWTRSLVKQEEMSGECFYDRGIQAEETEISNIPSPELCSEVKYENFVEDGSNYESSDEIVEDDNSMLSNEPNQEDVKTLVEENQSFKEASICICLLCKKGVKLDLNQNFLVPISNHFKKSHKKVYINKPLTHLIDTIILHNDPDKIKFFFEVIKKLKTKRQVRHFNKKNNEIKSISKYVLQARPNFICIICLVSVTYPGKNEDKLRNLRDHFNSSSHNQCLKEKMEINKAYKRSTKRETIKKLTVQKENFKELQKIKNQKKLLKELAKANAYMVTHGGSSIGHLNTNNIPKPVLHNNAIDQTCTKLGINHESMVKTVEGTSMHINLPNNAAVTKSSNQNLLVKDTNICFCLLCHKVVGPKSQQASLVSINHHFRIKHRIFYLRTPLEGLIDSVVMHNNPDQIKLMSKVVAIKKNLRKLIQQNFKIKIQKNCIFKTKTDYVCIFCMVSITPCLNDYNVLLGIFHKHFESSTHQQCEKEKIEINQEFKVKNNNEIAFKLVVQRENLKKRLQEKNEKRKLKKLQKSQKKLQKNYNF